MPSTTRIAAAILDTVLSHLAFLFQGSAGGDPAAARKAAVQTLAAYNVKTPDELQLAAELISFGFHALEALGQAADPDLPLNKVLRLRDSAVRLSREGHKAQRKLDQLQRARAAAVTHAPSIEATITPEPSPAPRPAAPSKSKSSENWPCGRPTPLAASRIIDSQGKRQIEHAINSVAADMLEAEEIGAQIVGQRNRAHDRQRAV